jgi:hypothetical protein
MVAGMLGDERGLGAGAGYRSQHDLGRRARRGQPMVGANAVAAVLEGVAET